MSANRCVTVVLPLVPVTPTVTNASAGWPNWVLAMHAIATRAVLGGTTTWATSSSRGRSTTSATAPLSTAAAAKSCPSAITPVKTEEQCPGLYLATVELERCDVNGTKVAAGLHDVYAFEQPVHTQRRAPVRFSHGPFVLDPTEPLIVPAESTLPCLGAGFGRCQRDRGGGPARGPAPGRGGHPIAVQRIAHHLGEHRRGHDTAEDRRGLLKDHDGRQGRVLGRVRTRRRSPCTRQGCSRRSVRSGTWAVPVLPATV